MGLRVIGAGLGRTGTFSLKLALTRLLGAPCYHMVDVFEHPEHVPMWHAAARGEMPDWETLFTGFAAAVDWPASAFWPELSAAYPDALVILSERDPEAWWRSTQATIFADLDQIPNPEWKAMIDDVFAARFTTEIHDHDACIALFLANGARARAQIDPKRLLVWTATDGWEPLCAALGVPVPDEPYPRVNTTEEWAARHNAPPTAADNA